MFFADQTSNDDANVVSHDNQFLIALKQLGNAVETMKSPMGSDRKNPARSCRDIFLATKESGQVAKNGNERSYFVMVQIFMFGFLH